MSDVLQWTPTHRQKYGQTNENLRSSALCGHWMTSKELNQGQWLIVMTRERESVCEREREKEREGGDRERGGGERDSRVFSCCLNALMMMMIIIIMYNTESWIFTRNK